MTVYLVGYAKRMMYPEQPTVLLAPRHLSITLLKLNFKNLSSILNIFQETHNSHGFINCLYLFKNYQQTFSWPGERLSFHLKVIKM